MTHPARPHVRQPRPHRLICGLVTTLLASGALAQTTPPAADQPASEPALRQFDAADARLAYDVLVGAGDLKSAFRVAQQAVQHLPRDPALRRRLAQIALWTAQTNVAAAQWLALFTMGDHTPEVVGAALAGAPELDRPLDALPLWEWKASRGTLEAGDWDRVEALFEDAAQPLMGADFFAREAETLRQPTLYTRAARLALHGGEDRKALALYDRRLAAGPFDSDALLQATVIAVRLDRYDDALDLMQRYGSRVPPTETELWRLMGQVAWQARQYDAAEKAMDIGVRSPRAEQGDWDQLIYLTRAHDPERAADLALKAWARYGNFDHWMTALEIYNERGDLVRLGKLYDQMTPAARQQAQRSVTFWLSRADYLQRTDDVRGAWTALSRAHRLAPRDDAVNMARLWFLIDADPSDRLGAELHRLRQHARVTPAYWRIFGAAYGAVGEPHRALPWYRRAVEASPGDVALLEAYAQTLDAAERPREAQRVRRVMWQQLEAQRAQQVDFSAFMRQPAWGGWLREWLRRHPGDPSWRMVQRLQASARDRSLPPELRDLRDELVMAWLLERDQPEGARRWAWQRYLALGRRLPRSTSIRLAQQGGDTATLAALRESGLTLPTDPEGATLEDALHLSRQSLGSSFAAMAHPGLAEPAVESFRDQALRYADYVEFRYLGEDVDSLQVQTYGFAARKTVFPGAQLVFDGSLAQQSSDDPDLAQLAPASPQQFGVQWRWFDERSENLVGLLQTQALGSVTGLHLRRTSQWDSRTLYRLDAVFEGPSAVSTPMRVAGLESQASALVQYAWDRHLYASLMPRWSRFETQLGDYLGTGMEWTLEAGYRFRVEYPDWRARVYVRPQSYSRDGSISAGNLQKLPAYLQNGISAGSYTGPSYFLPDDNTSVGACFSLGDNPGSVNASYAYTRAWRPYGDACLQNNDVLGAGYELMVGAAGAVWGSDQLSMTWLMSDNSAPGSATNRTLSVRYRHYF